MSVDKMLERVFVGLGFVFDCEMVIGGKDARFMLAK